MTPRHRLEALARDLPDPGGRVRLDTTGPIARLEIDRPEARNALTVQMMCDLLSAVDTLATWPGAVVVLCASTPGVFCAGGDLGQVRAGLGTPDVGRDMAIAMGAALDALLDLPCVSIAAVDGPAIGGGAELLTACDLRVLGPGARIDWAHVRLGVAPGWGGTARLVRLLGRTAALRLLGEGLRLDPAAAHAWGLADHVAPGPALPAALALAEPYANAPDAVRAVKSQITHPATAADAFASVWGGPAHRRALEAVPAGRGSTRS